MLAAKQIQSLASALDKSTPFDNTHVQCLHSQVDFRINLSREKTLVSQPEVQIETPPTLDPERLPRHVAIIMDGNGRWAQSQGMPRIEGHRKGVDSVRAIVEECTRLGLNQLTLYSFSSENWKRPKEETDLLMELLCIYLISERPLIMEQNIQFRTIGRVHQLAPEVQAELNETAEMSAANTGMKLCLALNYGSRAEIVDATRRIAQQVSEGTLAPHDITEETIASHLDTAGMIDPDLVIRTASEMRLSNFLLWQLSYAEIWVTDICWPEFREQHLHQAFHDFAKRDRRFGGLKEPTA